ncbi:uncharacterized protein K460DRAFT_317668 [Cucurbitaria berberidis CBS 394.84]|uniref:Aminoglycoside phosphotransferase domain-containing protein n=1 Tax=Cucurbitaria berberidis CBS 394.84 TaxID=1168544 RepID=A0A9P4GES6_9PLEO|nr:uncharacterized protein K460DRAFT_317668 [Cucurbitaria berberidis CBS 394.84]KAF1844292.1 hypothetical protein K460DRAFT_317668 [Cucurbitaria berberidis CBS 394.84]
MQETDKEICMRAMRERFPDHDIEECEQQGYCSFTIAIVPQGLPHISSKGSDFAKTPALDFTKCGDFVVQIRPVQHALELAMTQAAKRTYSTLAPRIQGLDLILPNQLCAYRMERLYGAPFSRLQPHSRTLDPSSRSKQENLVACFADFIAQGWRVETKAPSLDRDMRADSPMDDKTAMLLKCTGKVGSSIIARLEKIAIELPEQGLRDIARDRLHQIRNSTDFPVTLNHGDLIPSNILIDEETWEIAGVVDWAEAEYLPFGTCLYGLEHLLGYFSSASQYPTPPSYDTSTSSIAPEFVYFDNAPQLRALFWTRLLEAVPDLVSRRADVEMVRDVGVLLWYGIAWDGGAINRVVNEVDDAETIACLRAFLLAPKCCG